jgi:tungstate transport system permease protein
VPRQIVGKGLRLSLRHAPCAHICRYCLISETRKGSSLPFARFEQLVHRFYDWKIAARRDDLDIGIFVGPSFDYDLETLNGVRSSVRATTARDYANLPAVAINQAMQDFTDALYTAAALVVHFDVELREIVFLSLGVSLTASLGAFVIASPFGTALAMYRFRGRGALIVIANALLGLPPVVVGLVVYLLLSRSGPLGAFGILFTPTAMVIAQTLLGIPIVIALVHRMTVDIWAAYGDALLIDGASRLRAMIPIMLIGREGLVTAFLAAFGRAIAEVGAIIIVGGNIRGYTRTMTTAIALETSKGELSFALALGIILIILSMAVSALSLVLGRALTIR